jgi:pilus assembly protein CpaF
MVLMAGTELPLRAIREQISSAFDIIVYMERLIDGSRRITSITELLGMEEDTILMQNIFQFESIEREGRAVHELRPCGLRPMVMRKLERANHYMPTDLFETPQMLPSSSRIGMVR